MKSFRTAAAVAGMVVLVGCDIPTAVPKVEQRWILPAENTTISVDELLPTGVSVSGQDFAITVDPFNTSETVGQLCSICVNGAPGPVPAFTGTFTATQPLPDKVTGVHLTSASVQIAIHNGFSFDPIEGGGTLTVTLTDGQGGAQLGQIVVDGTSTSLASGSTLNRTLDVSPADIGATLFVSATVTSVGGQSANTNTANKLTVTATPSSLLVSSAKIDVSNRSVDISPVNLNVKDIDSSITDHIKSGAIILEIQNPWGIAFNGHLDIDYPGGLLSKPLAVSEGASTSTSLDYTAQDFKSFLGQDNVVISGAGIVAANAGVVTVTPGQKFDINAKIDLTLEIGG